MHKSEISQLCVVELDRTRIELDEGMLPTLWGAGPQQLHERLWASRRIQVVRSGGDAPNENAVLYLLVRPEDLVFFEPDEAVHKIRWLRADAVRIRISDRHHNAYTESTESAEDGTLLRIVRYYEPETHATSQAWLTARKDVANAWHGAPDHRAGKAAVTHAIGNGTTVVTSVKGKLLSASQHDKAVFHREMLYGCRNPGVVFERSFLHETGVWVHETSQIEEGARFVAPVWVGAGVRVEADDLCVGPLVIEDAVPIETPRRVSWEEVAIPEWKLLPPLGQRPGARAFKRAFDIVFSLCVLLATSWLYPIIMLVILIEDGWPVFFAHDRQTIGGREFPCYKFRTMRKDAELMKAELQSKNQADGPQFFIEKDPRLLKCGTLLRKLQLDELPQFWNVLVGHMSVVGPRPSPDKENQYCPAWREARLSIRPGVTGLWQVSRTRQPQTDFQEWIKFDLEYVQRASIRLDIWIIVNTLKRLIGR